MQQSDPSQNTHTPSSEPDPNIVCRHCRRVHIISTRPVANELWRADYKEEMLGYEFPCVSSAIDDSWQTPSDDTRQHFLERCKQSSIADLQLIPESSFFGSSWAVVAHPVSAVTIEWRMFTHGNEDRSAWFDLCMAILAWTIATTSCVAVQDSSSLWDEDRQKTVDNMIAAVCVDPIWGPRYRTGARRSLEFRPKKETGYCRIHQASEEDATAAATSTSTSVRQWRQPTMMRRDRLLGNSIARRLHIQRSQRSLQEHRILHEDMTPRTSRADGNVLIREGQTPRLRRSRRLAQEEEFLRNGVAPRTPSPVLFDADVHIAE